MTRIVFHGDRIEVTSMIILVNGGRVAEIEKLFGSKVVFLRRGYKVAATSADEGSEGKPIRIAVLEG
jgi:hypothetical protein